jgi:hypothetical protein
MSTTEKMSENLKRYLVRLEEIRADRDPRSLEAKQKDLLAAYELRRWDAFLAAAKEHNALKTLGIAGVGGVPEPEPLKELGAHGPQDRSVRVFFKSFRRRSPGEATEGAESRP